MDAIAGVLRENLIDKLKEAITLTFSNRNMKVPISFKLIINNFDMTILERSWNSVFVVGSKKTFNEMRDELMECLSKLDNLFKS